VEKIIRESLQESIRAKEEFISQNLVNITILAQRIVLAFNLDHKLMICGNGGSAADAQHLAAEFVNRFILERPPLPALALTTDTSILTSIGNDYSFEEAFSKQIKALGQEGDVLLAISTSGNSANIVAAVKTARKQGIFTAGLLGNDGGNLVNIVDLALIVRHDQTPRIQEAHIFCGHIICALVDYLLFQKNSESE
jgi:D-sedoheptulose 7-phosphate isomerase